jgi:hypothetical protein
LASKYDTDLPNQNLPLLSINMETLKGELSKYTYILICTLPFDLKFIGKQSNVEYDTSLII